MESQACPLLGSLTEQGSYLNYPNFENRCYATGRDEQVPLAQQQFFCLGGQFGSCPRYVTATRGPAALARPTVLQGAIQPWWDDEPSSWQAPAPPPAEPARRNRWMPVALGAGGAIVVLVLCLALVGGFLLWRLWSDRVQANQPTPVVAGPAVIRAATFTPTSDIPTHTPTATLDPQVVAAFATVTAVAQLTAEAGTLQPPPFVLTPRPTPTRRLPPEEGTVLPPPLDTPTPTAGPGTFPTGTPTPENLDPTWTPVPTEPLVPVVNFSAAPRTLLPGGCATLRWYTAGVEAVYLEIDGIENGVTGTGSRQVCPTAANTDYLLRVVLRDLSDQVWVASVEVRGTPTPTATPTWTWTPNWTPTPTFTPVPTATPTVTPQYAVQINGSNGAAQVAADGQAHAVGNYGIQNAGNVQDTIAVTLSGNAPAGWRLLLCVDGACFTDNLAELTFAAGAVKQAEMRVTVPPGTAGGLAVTLRLDAVSRRDASKQAAVEVVVTVQ